ncbi:hypothetical protein MKUB_05120 [Mycobacterium kubicae]|uniref:DUF1772 domain-containing protein n=1 Tax=Mycobacterium kubicae TaxID=120959 RepID=A0AAX1JC97_9MYCO|nr:anthrone oxygenase family protein [Mycobacterium kubicae]MCV7096347.1 DUF1772 domain-containing protein [Mycobacterium kubicae]ORW05158.1 hypothetical protein AWC13_26000 [Mycobacterium kubicae]QNI10873.1 DUF1772 domain-containing protein [Mycobacterium kubicae]QPI39081.1 DUF1772 domain-containing protein [Mycobacterium kubicae]GFG63022.1 hypothetical protein MKUB_05120 [Mycobacterium kubicae]
MTSSPASGLLQNASDFAAVLFTGLFAGFLVTVLVLEASLRRFGAAVYTQVRLIELQHLDDLATALLLPGILAAATVTLIHIRQGHSRRWLAGAALLLLVATLLISVTISVPINTVQQTWSIPNPPANWAAVRDRWQLAHAARTITAVVAFLALATRSAPRTAA